MLAPTTPPPMTTTRACVFMVSLSCCLPVDARAPRVSRPSPACIGRISSGSPRAAPGRRRPAPRRAAACRPVASLSSPENGHRSGCPSPGTRPRRAPSREHIRRPASLARARATTPFRIAPSGLAAGSGREGAAKRGRTRAGPPPPSRPGREGARFVHGSPERAGSSPSRSKAAPSRQVPVLRVADLAHRDRGPDGGGPRRDRLVVALILLRAGLAARHPVQREHSD